MKPRLKRLNTHGYTALNHNGKEFNQISCIQINVYFNIAQEERSFPIKIYLTLLLTIFWESKKINKHLWSKDKISENKIWN